MTSLQTLQQAGFSRSEARKLEALRQRYPHGNLRAQFTEEELRRLEFVRWLISEGRLTG